MPDGGNIGLLIDGSFDSLLTAVYHFYYKRLNPCEIHCHNAYQPTLGTEYVSLQADPDKAERVAGAIRRDFPRDIMGNIDLTMLFSQEDKYINLFRYIIAGFKLGRELDDHKHLEYVLYVLKAARNVSGETHKLKGFVRFALTPEGFYYADISPVNHVLPVLTPHFADRFGGEKFIIHDVKRGEAAVFDGTGWYVTDLPGEARPQNLEDDVIYRRLWKTFYDAIGIEARKNPNLRRNLMPKRYWKHLTEFTTQMS